MEVLGNMLRFLLCVLVLTGIAYAFSVNRKAIDWKLIGKALGLQVVIALIAFKLEWFALVLAFIARLFVKVYNFSLDGSRFIFGPLENIDSSGWIFAIQVLPSLIFFSALFSFLFYLRILHRLTICLSW